MISQMGRATYGRADPAMILQNVLRLKEEGYWLMPLLAGPENGCDGFVALTYGSTDSPASTSLRMTCTR
jgi:hypothetical protein